MAVASFQRFETAFLRLVWWTVWDRVSSGGVCDAEVAGSLRFVDLEIKLVFDAEFEIENHSRRSLDEESRSR